ncbi:putative kelch-type beta propeller [Rosa chinensis]|uniref:Putative kelch-type beta propeller n=1 Tax=Rosa chinensis TaxID=74649 RepID=A0A2P6RW90_ROSCH|nr:uncharacterized protein LOC112185639 [Rosa chinensis]PRQ50694.1 putative kelch-type beta propeller [Rosa chinensis]
MEEKVENYLYLQFKDHLRRVNLNKLEEQKESPEFELVADFLEEKLPYGMCVFLQDSNKLYMVGGERIRKNERAGRYWWRGFLDAANEPDSSGLSCDVFVLDSSNGKISAAPGFPKPKGPKINARALATMGDKVYVMSFRPYYYHGTLPSPAFECYDSAKQSWEELPVPPNYYCSSSAATTYGFHFVLGTKIYLCTPHGFFCYNVDQSPPKWEFIEDAEWQFDQLPSYNSEEEMEDNKIEDYSLPLIPALPYRSICFAEPGKGGLAVGYTAQGLVGYFFAPNGSLLYQEPLNQLNSNSKLPSPNSYFFGGKVCYVGENKFCLILSGEIDQTSWSWSLAVATFDVKCKANVHNGEGGGKHFYHDLPLCYHQFDNINSCFSNACKYENSESPRLYDYLNLQDAFVISSEPKSQRHHNHKRKRIMMGVGFQLV